MNIQKEICTAVFLLHEFKIGPSSLMVKQKNAMLTRIHQLESRALKFLAGAAKWEEPKEILAALNDAIAEVCSTIPKTRLGPGNPGKSKALTGDVWVVRQHHATGRKIPDLVAEAIANDKLDDSLADDRHVRRIRRLVKSGKVT